MEGTIKIGLANASVAILLGAASILAPEEITSFMKILFAANAIFGFSALFYVIFNKWTKK